jgi:hypothetical protein
MATTSTVQQFGDAMVVAVGGLSITVLPTFQQGYVPNVVDGFRFTIQITGATQMPTKIFRYRLVPTKIQPAVNQPPTAIEYLGTLDGVCSPADLEDFPEDWPVQNARPPWYRLDYVDLIVRSRSIADQAYQAILFEVQSLVDTLYLMNQQVAAPPVTITPGG